MPNTFNPKAANVPTEGRAAKLVQRYLERGDFDEYELKGAPGIPRYLVTYMNSQTGGRVRSATVVSVTNQSPRPNLVTVAFFKGFANNTSPSGVATFSIPPDFTVDFGSRDLPTELTAVNSTSTPPLTFDEGRAIVSSRLAEIGVSSRVYYTSGDKDEQLLAITDSKVVKFDAGNLGD
jgi:hypothetical protein